MPASASLDRGREASRRQWLLLGLIWLVYVVHAVDRSIVLVLLDAIARDFRLNDSEAGLIAGLAYALPFALAGIPLGALVDRVNRMRLLATLLALWSGLTALTGLAANYTMLLLARAGVGAVEAGAPTAMLSILGDSFDNRRRPLAISIYYTAPFAGLILGSIVAGLLGQVYGWRVALMAIGAPGLLLALLIFLVLREPRRGAFAANPTQEAPVSIAAALRHILLDPALRTLVAALVLGGVAITSVAAWTPTLLQRVHGVTQAEAGSLTALALGVAGGVGTVFGGTLASRVAKGEPHLLRRMCGIVLIAASPALLAAPLVEWLPAVIVLLALWSLVAGAYIAPAWNLCVTLCPSHMRGTVLATSLVLANLIGSGAGPWLVGKVSDLLAAAGDPAHLQHAMAGLAGFAVVTAFLFLTGSRSPVVAARN